MLLRALPIVWRRRSKSTRRGNPRPLPPPAALTLVSASYSGAFTHLLVLQFDRAIDIAALVGGAIAVVDGGNGKHYLATGAATLTNAQTLSVGLVFDHTAIGTGVKLTAGADSGIVAVDDGGTWDGVSDLALPFP